MKTNKTQMKSLAWALLAGASALLLAASLPLLLSHFQALAQPVAEVTAANLEVQKDVNTPLAAPGDTLTYTIELGLYDPLTGERWAVLDDAGQPIADRILLPAVEGNTTTN